MDLSRRNFLQMGAAGALAAGAMGLAGCASQPQKSESGKAEGSTSEDWLGEAPATKPEDCKETVDCEVVVVGAALAGSMAAYGAVKNGAKVTVLERNASAHIGGMTISFLNSQAQLDAGIPKHDKVHVANQMFTTTQYRSDMKLNAVWCNRSGKIFDDMVKDFLEPYNQYYKILSLEGIFPIPRRRLIRISLLALRFRKIPIF